MCFLLHLNEDFDDDLLMEAVDLIAWLTDIFNDIINTIHLPTIYLSSNDSQFEPI